MVIWFAGLNEKNSVLLEISFPVRMLLWVL
jgi:hypothetical protein